MAACGTNAASGQIASPTEPAPTVRITARPTARPTPTLAPTVPPTPIVFAVLSDRDWAKVVKDPDAYNGSTYQIWACITQFSAATGPDTFRGQAANVKLDSWFGDGVNAFFVGSAGDLAEFVEDDVVSMNVLAEGALTYDNTSGGSTTAPLFGVAAITLQGSC